MLRWGADFDLVCEEIVAYFCEVAVLVVQDDDVVGADRCSHSDERDRGGLAGLDANSRNPWC